MNRNRETWRYVHLIMSFTAGLLLIVGSALAQVDSGNVVGRIVDPNGAPLVGATVSISGSSAPQSYVTSSDGNYRFLRLAPGKYELTAELAGIGKVVQAVEVTVGNSSELNLKLGQSMSETITVSAATPVIDRRQTGTGENLSRIELQEVPTARDPWVMLQSIPSVLVDRVNVGGNKSGQQSYFVGKGVERHQTEWNLDGTTVTEMQATGTSGFYYDFDSFEEMRISTGSTDPSVRTPGVQINMVTKRGTNDLKGSARYFWTDDSLQSDPSVPAEAVSYLPSANSINNIQDYGAEAGGPILRDRLWIWGAYGTNPINIVSCATCTDFQKTSLTSWNGKLNGQLTPSNSANVYYMWNNKTVHGRGLGGSRRTIEVADDQSGPGHVIKLEDTHSFGPRFFVTALASDTANGYRLDPIGGTNTMPYWDDATGTWNRTYRTYWQDVPQKQYRADSSAFVKTGSIEHELKFGFGYRKTPVESATVWPGGGWVEFYEDGDHLAALTRDAIPKFGSNYRDLYVGDTIVLGNFVITGGARYDMQRAQNDPSEVAANPIAPDLLPATSYAGDTRALEWKSVSPRLGATWSFGGGRNIIRGQYARYVDQLGSGDVGPNNPFYRIQILYYHWQDLNGDKLAQRNELGEFSSAVRIDRTNPTAGFSTGRVDFGMDPTKTDEFVLGYQREIGPSFGVAVNYSHRMRTDFSWTIYEKTRGAGDFYTDDDWDLANPRTTNAVLPDGTKTTIPYYRLKATTPRPLWQVTTNRPDYDQTYDGLELIATKRMTSRWMMRGNITLSDWKQHVGRAGIWDPSRRIDNDSCNICDGDAVGSNGGANGYINSRWSCSLNGIYQFPYKIMFGAALSGREGYIIPYYRRQNTSEGFGNRSILATDTFDEFRLDDVINVDLRLAKEFGLPAGIGLNLSLDLFNATDERTVLWRDNRLYGSDTLYANGQHDSRDNRIQELQSPRVWRLGARITF